MRNGHIVLRLMLSSLSMGATVFRSDNTIPYPNPLFDRGDTTDPKYRLGNAYRQGIVPFLKLVEAGVVPSAPDRSQLKGISPVALALPAPNVRFQDQSIYHNFNQYVPQPQQFAVNNLECWHAYTNVADYDITAIAHGSTRRFDSLFPHSAAGFVPLVPFSSRSRLESAAFPWCKRAFETDVNTWAEFGANLTGARDVISAELLRQREASALLVVAAANAGDPESGHALWQLTSADVSSGGSAQLFLMLMDPGALSPRERRVALRLGGGAEKTAQYEVFDQLGSQTAPLGTLAGSEQIAVVIPAGSVRFLVMRPEGSYDTRSPLI
jgi:hypothetical protein